ncbi:hypothetical protein LTR16_005378, partial [Cryomyces antarcticus]
MSFNGSGFWRASRVGVLLAIAQLVVRVNTQVLQSELHQTTVYGSFSSLGLKAKIGHRRSRLADEGRLEELTFPELSQDASHAPPSLVLSLRPRQPAEKSQRTCIVGFVAGDGFGQRRHSILPDFKPTPALTMSAIEALYIFDEHKYSTPTVPHPRPHAGSAMSSQALLSDL